MAENVTDFDGVPWQLIDALPAAIYVTDPAGRITYFNEAAAAFWGHRPKLHSDQWCGSWRLYGLDGTPMPHDQCPMAIALKQGRAIRGGRQWPSGLTMAVAHKLLSQSGWLGVGLTSLVHTQLAPYATDGNITISGTDQTLTAEETQAVAMVVHELVTNAAKYGALSVPEGQVSVTWDRKLNGDATAILMLEWRELNGPPIATELQSGYGTGLIRDLVPHELGGKVDLVFDSGGVICRIEIPVEKTGHEIGDCRA